MPTVQAEPLPAPHSKTRTESNRVVLVVISGLRTMALQSKLYSRRLLFSFIIISLHACVSYEPLPPLERNPDGSIGTTSTADEQEWPADTEESAEPDAGEASETDTENEERVAIATPESVARAPERGHNSATAQLRRQARTASAAGNQNQAIRLLERALRISSREPATYYEFASVRLRQDRRAEALQLARKGLSLRPELSLRNDLQQIVQLSSQ